MKGQCSVTQQLLARTKLVRLSLHIFCSLPHRAMNLFKAINDPLIDRPLVQDGKLQ